MSIGYNIKTWREKRDLKQSDLADLIGVSDKTVSSWETNRTEPKMGMIEKICAALNCKKTDIVGGDASSNVTTLDYTLPFNNEFNIIIEYTINSNKNELERLHKILSYYQTLSELGQKKVLDNISDLSQIYSVKEPILNAASIRTDIDIPIGTDTSEDDIFGKDF